MGAILLISRFFSNHKKLGVIITSILTFALLALYLYAASLPGIWHQNTFLYKQDDGSFLGKNAYAEYEMHITEKSHGTSVAFRVNDTIRNYLIIQDNNSVEIYENEKSVFSGTVITIGDTYILNDIAGPIDFTVSTTSKDDYFTVPDENEQYPSYTALYNRAIRNNTDRRGNFLMVFVTALLAIFLIIDIKYPDFFFLLKYRMHVDGGSPSEFYRFGQKTGRIISVIAIVCFIIATFVVH